MLAMAIVSTNVEAPIASAALFKNGYAVVIREIKVGPTGEYLLPKLPQSSFGTLWFATSNGLKLMEVANVGREETVKTNLGNLGELMQLNGGKTVEVTYYTGDATRKVDGKLVAAGPDLAVFEVGGETVAVPMQGITKVTSRDKLVYQREVKQPLRGLRFRTEGSGTITMVSLERGLSWSPAYALELVDEKTVRVTSKATIINDLEALKGVEARLVTGFPNMPYAGSLDPLVAGPQMIADMGLARGGPGGFGGGAFANQAPAASRMQADFAGAMPIPAEAGEQKEDLFFYPLKNVNLGEGDRSYHIIFDARAEYNQLFTWDVEDEPANPGRRGIQPQQPNVNVVWNTIRFKNTMGRPLTTGPATIYDEGDILGQNQMDYTPVGGTAEVKVNQALDIVTDTLEEESNREIGFIKYPNTNNPRYDRSTVNGTLQITNLKAKTVKVRVRKSVTGEALLADNDGKIVKRPGGLRDVNPQSDIEWTVEVAPGKTHKLTYQYRVLIPS